MLPSGIYIITNTIDKKCYIGSSVNINRRWINHKSALNNNKHKNQHLQRAWNKYGSEVFKYSVLLYCSKHDLLFYEQRAIDSLKPEYNTCMIAGNTLGYKHNDETRAKISTAAKISAAKRVISEETKHKISKTLTGRKGNPNPNKLSLQIEQNIIKDLYTLGITKTKLARKYNINRITIYRILKRNAA